MGLRTGTTCGALVLRASLAVRRCPDTYERGRNAKRTLENIARGNVELSSDDLSEIDGVFSSHAVKGGWYFDTVPDEKLHLWG